jgi:pyruvate ferredoxin oxidoreductase beta subunit
VHGKAIGGKQEHRKENAQIAMMHPHTYVAQTTCAHTNHFFRSVLGALEFDGPALICCLTTCQPEHGVADNMASHQARLAVDTRAFPLLIYDPRKGEMIKKRLSLQGNPAMKEDWWTDPKTKRVVDFIDFCRSEGRFANSTAALIWNLRHKSLSTKDLCTHAWCLHLELRRRLMCHKF